MQDKTINPTLEPQPTEEFNETEKVLAQQQPQTPAKPPSEGKKFTANIIKIIIIIIFFYLAYLVLKSTGILDQILQGVGLLDSIGN